MDGEALSEVGRYEQPLLNEVEDGRGDEAAGVTAGSLAVGGLHGVADEDGGVAGFTSAVPVGLSCLQKPTGGGCNQGPGGRPAGQAPNSALHVLQNVWLDCFARQWCCRGAAREVWRLVEELSGSCALDGLHCLADRQVREEA
jgi:hypothetical protein